MKRKDGIWAYVGKGTGTGGNTTSRLIYYCALSAATGGQTNCEKIRKMDLCCFLFKIQKKFVAEGG